MARTTSSRRDNTPELASDTGAHRKCRQDVEQEPVADVVQGLAGVPATLAQWAREGATGATVSTNTVVARGWYATLAVLADWPYTFLYPTVSCRSVTCMETQ